MSFARFCLIAAAILALNTCSRGSVNPSPPAVARVTPAPAPPAERTASLPPPVVKSAANKVSAPVVKTPAPTAQVPKPAAPLVATLAIDLDGLKQQLKDTKAIGLFSKISLKNQVDDLMKQFHDFNQGKANITMAELHRSYDLLMMKVLSMVQDNDQKLASAIVSSREAIWNLLADPKKFATLES